MSDYISREAAIKAVCDCSAHTCKMGECFNSCNEAKALSSIPAADVVEVVRCGECKYYNDKLEMYSDYVCTIRHYCDGSPIIVGKDDFCSSGRRKDGGQEE